MPDIRAYRVSVGLEVTVEGPLTPEEACNFVTAPLGAAVSAVRLQAEKFDGYRVRHRPGMTVSAVEVPVA